MNKQSFLLTLFLLAATPQLAHAATEPLTTLEAETMPTKTTGGAVTGGWNIWTNGYIESTVSFPETATYEFQIVARGSYAGGAWPNMELRIDQTAKASVTVNASTWTTFTKQISVTQGSRKVAIAFTNDYYASGADRNLYVDKVVILKVVPDAPSAPVLNQPVAADKQVTLTWNAVSGAGGYKVKYGTASGSYGTPVDVGNVTSKPVTNLANGTKYYFVVTAYNQGGESVKSNEVSATPAAAVTQLLTTLEAESMATKTTGGAVAGGWNIWSNGYIESTVSFPATGIYEFQIIARGNYAGGAWPNMELRIDQTAAASVTVNASNWTTFTKQISVTQGSRKVAIAFTNDYYASGADRNLYVDKVVILKVVPRLPMEFVKNVDYNAAGQITKVAYGNGTVTDYTYDLLTLRLTRLKTTDAQAQVIQDLSYTYDSLGNILQINDAIHSDSQTFQYDALNRLTQATGDNYASKAYAYDQIGNITTKEGVSYTYAQNGAGPHAVTSLTDGTTMAYDVNGNMVSKNKAGVITTYEYDVENRLLKVKQGAITLEEYEYDGDGGRTKKTTYDATNPTVVTKFTGSLYEEANNRITKHLFLGDKRIGSITNGALIFIHENHLGSANIITDDTGLIKELIEYEPYGKFARHEKYGSSEEIAWHYFTGQRLDEKTGLYYYGARYYDPSLARFITPDTIVQSPGNPQTFNRYTYANNNPVVNVDRDGHFWFVAFIIAAVKGAVIGAAVGAATAAIMGGDIGKGALFGAIGGAAFAGLSSGFTSLAKFAMTGTTNVSLIGNAATTVNILGAAVAGAGAGAAGSAYLGTDPLNGAGIGALSGGLFGSISGMKGTGWAGAGRIAIAGAAGGAISEIAGGSFLDGFVFASSIASADFIYRAILRSQGYERGASMRTATKSAQPKLDANGNLIDNKPVLSDLDISQPGILSKPAEAMDSLWEKFLNFTAGETGTVMNFAGKNVPGVQGLSLAHDITGYYLSGTVGRTANGLFLNFQTMPPVYGLNLVGSSINDNPAFIGTSTMYRRNRE